MDNYANYQLDQIIDTDELLDKKGEGESECCGAGTYGDYKICEDCGENC